LPELVPDLSWKEERGDGAFSTLKCQNSFQICHTFFQSSQKQPRLLPPGSRQGSVLLTVMVLRALDVNADNLRAGADPDRDLKTPRPRRDDAVGLSLLPFAPSYGSAPGKSGMLLFLSSFLKIIARSIIDQWSFINFL